MQYFKTTDAECIHSSRVRDPSDVKGKGASSFAIRFHMAIESKDIPPLGRGLGQFFKDLLCVVPADAGICDANTIL